MKRLTHRQKENKNIEKIVKRLKNMEGKYPPNYLRSACSRFVARATEKIRLQREIAQREKELVDLKKER